MFEKYTEIEINGIKYKETFNYTYIVQYLITPYNFDLTYAIEDAQAIIKGIPHKTIDKNRIDNLGYHKLLFQSKKIDKLIKKLKQDPNTRQAIIYLSDITTLPQQPSCLSSIQCFIRNEELLMTVNFRSQINTQTPYDAFNLTQIQNYIAKACNIKTGIIYVNVANFHSRG